MVMTSDPGDPCDCWLISNATRIKGCKSDDNYEDRDPSRMSPVTAATFQIPKESQGLKATMAGLGCRVTPWFGKE